MMLDDNSGGIASRDDRMEMGSISLSHDEQVSSLKVGFVRHKEKYGHYGFGLARPRFNDANHMLSGLKFDRLKFSDGKVGFKHDNGP